MYPPQKKLPLGARINYEHPLLRSFALGLLFDEQAGPELTDFSRNRVKTFFADVIGQRTIVQFQSGPFGPAPSKPTVRLSNVPAAGPFTVSAWVKPASTPLREVILCKWDDLPNKTFFLGINFDNVDSLGRVQFALYNGSDNVLTSTTSIAGVWSHVCATYDGTTARLYVNGQEEASQAVASLNTTTIPAVLGGIDDFDPGESYIARWNGQIDLPMLWNRALSAYEINTLRQNPLFFYLPVVNFSQFFDASVSSSCDLYVRGYSEVSPVYPTSLLGTVGSYGGNLLCGMTTPRMAGALGLFTFGSTGSAHLAGLDLSTWGQSSLTASVDAYIRGYTASLDELTPVDRLGTMQSVAGNIIPGLHYPPQCSRGVPLYLDGAPPYPPPVGKYSITDLYAEGHETYSSEFPLFLAGTSYSLSDRPLFLKVPQNPSGTIPMVCWVETNTPESNVPLYVRGEYPSASDAKPLFVFNSAWDISASVPLAIHAYGIRAAQRFSSELYLYLERNPAIGETLPLYLYGPGYPLEGSLELFSQGNLSLASGISLAVPYTIGFSSGSKPMYVRGY